MDLTPDHSTLLLPFKISSPSGAQPLRTGIVMEGQQTAPWVEALLKFLNQIPGIDLFQTSLSIDAAPAAKRPGWLIDRLYKASRAKFDPFGDPASHTMDGNASLDDIRAAGCDVIIWLAGSQFPDVKLSGLAKHGVFTVRWGAGNHAIPFWKEVANNCVTSFATIYWHDHSLAQGRDVQSAELSSSPGLYITLNAEQPLIAAIRMLASLLLEIQSDGPRFAGRAKRIEPQPLPVGLPPDYPSDCETARFAAGKLMRSAYRRWATRDKSAKWFISIRPNRSQSITDQSRIHLQGLQEVPLPNGVEAMADPFLWEAGGRNYLLFEEVARSKTRGRLACVEILKNGAYSEMKIILDKPYHLSYPCVIPENGELFLLPEAAEAKRVEMYRFTKFPWEMEHVATAIDGVALVDTTPIFIDGTWYFFTTTQEPFMETLLFCSSRLEGPWKLHPSNPVSLSVKNSRSAGQLFWKDGRLYRPTQDCSVCYGYAVVVNEVTKLTPTEFEERMVSYIPPTWSANLLGTHTWNENSAFQVVDGIRYAQ